MRLEERARPSLLHKISIVFLIPSRFCIGSPMPIKTILSRVPACCSIYKNCSTISEAVKFRARPRVPVMQKAHFIAQPAWQDTQAVFRPSLSVSKTVSTELPSWSATTILIVPSGSVSTLSIFVARKRAFCLSSLRKSRLRFVIKSKSCTPVLIHLKICLPRKF